MGGLFCETLCRVDACIEVAKERDYNNTVNMLMNIPVNSKIYWPLPKKFKNNNKIPIIPPLFNENRFINDFKEKAKLLISFLNNAPLFLIIALFLLISTILLKNAYLQLHFQPKILEKSFKISFKQTPWTL